MPVIARTTARALSPRRPPVSAKTPKRPRSADPLRRLDHAIEAKLGADLRLIYGMAAPILLVLAAMVAFFLSPSYWLVGAVLVLELGCLGFVVAKVLAMLSEDDESHGTDSDLDVAPSSQEVWA